MVEGFTVGRRGFGQVHFPGKTDVYGFNLDELGVLGLRSAFSILFSCSGMRQVN